MELSLIRTPQGFAPVSDEDIEACQKIRFGREVRAKIVQPRNPHFFRKWWVLAKFAFDLWTETVEPQMYKGLRVLPDFEKFRKDLTVLAGFYRPVFNAKGECRLEPESLQWGRMSEERFEQLYSATINVILNKIIPHAGLSEDELRATVDRLMLGFA